ncbi:MAG: hypothetical protein OHK005_02340 [Candidatus Methylacidiphilales bacterium]
MLVLSGRPANHLIMKAWQFWTLNGMSAVLVLLVIVQFFLSQDLVRLQQRVLGEQREVQQAQASEQVLRALALRVAQVSEKEPDLNNLLLKYNVRVNQNANP